MNQYQLQAEKKMLKHEKKELHAQEICSSFLSEILIPTFDEGKIFSTRNFELRLQELYAHIYFHASIPLYSFSHGNS